MAQLLYTIPIITTSQVKTIPFFSLRTPKKQLSITGSHRRTRNVNFSPLGVAVSPSVPASDRETATREEEEFRSVDDEFGEEGGDSKFSWGDHWYPVSLVEDLDQNLLTPFQLLGRDLVL